MLQLSENQHISHLKGKKILVAISGGLDSVTLAHWLDFQGVELLLAHCNFRLRGEESDADERFVIDFGKKLGVKTITQRFDTEAFAKENGLNIQLSARKIRYDWFEKLAEENGCDFIATAHHFDDNLETFFINLLRGTGIKGLAGIPTENKKIIRPFLNFSRKEIELYALENQLVWREDSSNQTDKYLRNKLRHHILPTLEEINPSFEENLKKTQIFLNQSINFIVFFIEKIKKECFSYQSENEIKIDIANLKKQPEIDLVLYHLFYPYHFKNINDIKQLLNSQSGKMLFSSSHRLLKDRFHLILQKNEEKFEEIYEISEKTDEISLPFSIKIEFFTNFNKNNWQKNEKIAYFDADLLKFPLKISKKKENDFFYPLGMTQKNR